jgi:formiminotetrahydrofolate cyclodeaminase
MSDPSFRAMTVADFVERTGAKSPTPGGGSVAGVVGSLGAALARMVVNYSIGRKSLAEHQPSLEQAERRLRRAAAMMLEFADEDAAAYGAVNERSRLPEGHPDRAGLEAARLASAQVPLSLAATAVDLLRHFRSLEGTTNPHLRSDLAIAAVLARATVEASHWNVEVNLPTLDPAVAATTKQTMATLLAAARDLSREVEQACQARP